MGPGEGGRRAGTPAHPATTPAGMPTTAPEMPLPLEGGSCTLHAHPCSRSTRPTITNRRKSWLGRTANSIAPATQASCTTANCSPECTGRLIVRACRLFGCVKGAQPSPRAHCGIPDFSSPFTPRPLAHPSADQQDDRSAGGKSPNSWLCTSLPQVWRVATHLKVLVLLLLDGSPGAAAQRATLAPSAVSAELGGPCKEHQSYLINLQTRCQANKGQTGRREGSAGLTRTTTEPACAGSSCRADVRSSTAAAHITSACVSLCRKSCNPTHPGLQDHLPGRLVVRRQGARLQPCR